jgi:hypothetical protein
VTTGGDVIVKARLNYRDRPTGARNAADALSEQLQSIARQMTAFLDREDVDLHARVYLFEDFTRWAASERSKFVSTPHSTEYDVNGSTFLEFVDEAPDARAARKLRAYQEMASSIHGGGAPKRIRSRGKARGHSRGARRTLRK